MFSLHENEKAARQRAEQLLRGSASLDPVRLGAGIDGIVFSTSHQSAVKVYERPEPFEREVAAYRRLKKHKVKSVCGHAVPIPIQYSTKLHVVEMSIVRPPYVLDFGKSWVDAMPDMEPERIALFFQQAEEKFEDRFSRAMDIYNELKNRYGIYYFDMKPGNIEFGDDR